MEADANNPEHCHAPPPVVARTGDRRVALVGNPNAGKSTLFNALTGGGAPVGNYAGTTVERYTGRMQLDGVPVQVIDVPGTWSLAARSPEERIAIDAALGLGTHPAPDALVVVVDAPRLLRSLYLVLQLLDLRVPIVIAVNLMDEARAEGRVPDIEALRASLHVPVVAIVARHGEGLDALRAAIRGVLQDPSTATPGCPHDWPDPVARDVDEVAALLPPRLIGIAGTPGRARALAAWLLLSVDDDEALEDDPDVPRAAIGAVRERAAAAGRDLETDLVGPRYQWLDARQHLFVRSGGGTAVRNLSDRIDHVLLHPLWGTLVFVAVMAVVFQALFSWSDPAISVIEGAFGLIGTAVEWASDRAVAMAPLGGLTRVVGDLLQDGVIGGVGSVIVFVPQIALLFFFVAVLEDSGYLARAAHLMDRLLRLAGLPGRAFVPLLSGFACAVPAIMATRTMPRFRDRLVTMAVIPLTSCSARLPVYALMIGALFPATLPGSWVPLRPIALFAMYLFSTVMTVLAATVIGRTVMRDRATPDLIELPPYRLPHVRTVTRLVASRVGDFLREAGQMILIATLVLWALLYFPRYSPEEVLPPETIAAAEAHGDDVAALAAPRALEKSFAGRLGHLVEPAIAPLGFDWQVGIGLIGAFAAREVFVSTMGVVYGIGDADETSRDLRERLRTEQRADGTPRYTPLVGASLMVFFALAMQCMSTLAVLRRESGGWRWPAFVVAYMTVLAWVASFVVYQGGLLLGFH